MANSDFVCTLTKYTGHDADVVIPDGVTYIGDYAFDGNDTMRSVRIPGSIVTIGRYAFSGCSALTRIELSEGVNRITECAFFRCEALCEVTLPDSLMNWDWNAFDDCDLLKLFRVPALSQVRQIPDVLGVPAVDMRGALLPPVPVDEDEWNYEKRGGEICITGRKTGRAGTLFQRTGLVTTLYIPAMIEGLPVTSIGDKAFEGDCYIDALYLPDGLRAIGREAFGGCKELCKVRVPKSLKTVAEDAFDSCYELEDEKLEPLYVYEDAENNDDDDDGDDDDGGDEDAYDGGGVEIDLSKVKPDFPAFCKLSADILADFELDEISLRRLWAHCAKKEKVLAIKILFDRVTAIDRFSGAVRIVNKLFALFESANG